MQVERFLRRKDVEQATGLGRSTIYDRMKEGSFPRPVPVGKRAVAWRESDVARWQAERIAAAAPA